jgi:predicted ribosome quality control (RQC) complex YloA/Tae2 family protein
LWKIKTWIPAFAGMTKENLFVISNYYILHSAVREISQRFLGARFLRAFSIHAGELRMEFDQGELVAAMQPAHTTFYISSIDSHEPKRNVMSFFEELQGLPLIDIILAENDKLVTLDFEEYHLLLRFYNSPNILLIKNNTPQSSFKKESIRPLSPITPLPDATTIRQHLPMLGKWLEAELEFELREKNDYDLAEECKVFDKKLRTSPSLFIYSKKDGLVLSPIKLRSLSENYKEYKSPSLAIEEVIRYRAKHSTFVSKKNSLTSKLHGALTRTEKAISDAHSGINNSAREDKYSATGDAIQLHAHEIIKGQESIAAEVEGKNITIVLDPSLSGFENAKRYYDKARRARENRKELQTKYAALILEKEKLSRFLAQAENAWEIRELDVLEKEISRSGFALHQTSDDLTEVNPLSRFRNFIVAGGYRVLVGKNAKQNDELTMKVAKKEDIWFHARHVPGSHVVLQTNNAKQIPKEAIEQAAAIAAYFSDAKTQKHAPVAYTKRKFVRKPKGAAPGAVLLEREEVVIVTPRIPIDL